MFVRSGRGALAAALGAVAFVAAASPAAAAVPHLVAPGESLWSVASANGISVESLAAYNGLSSDSLLYTGETIQVPSATEVGVTTTSTSTGSAAGHVVQPGESLWSVASANGITISSLAAYNGLSEDSYLTVGQTLQIPTATSSTTTGPGGTIPSPYGDLPLDPAAADSWNSMREASLSQYGVDLYPGGPLSAYRTYEQQAYLYDQYLSGQGSPANPPGTSTHELGIAVDVADPSMRDVIDQIGGAYGWYGTIPSEWWHVEYGW